MSLDEGDTLVAVVQVPKEEEVEAAPAIAPPPETEPPATP